MIHPKQEFINPTIEIISFEHGDVITSSSFDIDMPEDEIWNPLGDVYLPEDALS